MRYCLNYTGTRFLSTENKNYGTQFPLFRLNILGKKKVDKNLRNSSNVNILTLQVPHKTQVQLFCKLRFQVLRNHMQKYIN